MEAETFEIVNSALSSNRRIARLPVRYVSGVQRIVWSVWNYIVGPELKFVWEVVPGDVEALVAHPCRAKTANSASSLNMPDLSVTEHARPKPCSTSDSTNSCLVPCSPVEFSQIDSHTSAVSTDCHASFGDEDDRYIAMHTLSSEIYHSTSSDSVEFKVLRLPERKVAVGAYTFRAKHCDQQCVNSIAFVVNESRMKWFLQLQPFMEPYLEDLVLKMRAILLIERLEDALSRLTSELSHLLLLLGVLDFRSLESTKFDIADTHFADPNLSDNRFLYKCISAHLQCKCHTLVVGNFSKSINKMLKTLAFVTYREFWPMSKFVDVDNPEVDSAFEVLCCKDCFSPHLFLQACSKLHLRSTINQAFYSRWPFCVIDVDEQTVCDSLPFEKHSALRKEVLTRDMKNMLLHDVPKKRLNINLKEHVPDNTLVSAFLNQMDVLPYRSTVRVGFTLQFLRTLTIKGMALDAYARAESQDGADPTKLRRSNICKALDVRLRGDFMIILSAADVLRPDLAAFLVQSWVR